MPLKGSRCRRDRGDSHHQNSGCTAASQVGEGLGRSIWWSYLIAHCLCLTRTSRESCNFEYWATTTGVTSRTAAIRFMLGALNVEHGWKEFAATDANNIAASSWFEENAEVDLVPHCRNSSTNSRKRRINNNETYASPSFETQALRSKYALVGPIVIPVFCVTIKEKPQACRPGRCEVRRVILNVPADELTSPRSYDFRTAGVERERFICSS